VEDLLNVVKPRVGEHYLVTPGMVHAAQDVRLLEVAESSELWFRLHAWDDPEAELHLEEAFDLIDFKPYRVAPAKGDPEAVTEKTILQTEVLPYNNPAVSMSTEEMARFARRVWDSPARYRNVGARKHHMNIRLNNIYSAGEYFFIDFSVQNRTNIRFDIDQIRVKVEDKRQTRAANCQSIEITPAMILENSSTFLHGYRNVIVLKKLTFPNDKVLTIEMSEKQVSGRTITLSIDYEDVLYADSFSETLLEED